MTTSGAAPPGPRVVSVDEALADLAQVNSEIRHKGCIEGDGFTVGLISFNATGAADPKQIVHDDKDVVCHVLRGRGRLRAAGKTTRLRPGLLCHIPRGVPHDFAAERGELVLCYSLITTRR